VILRVAVTFLAAAAAATATATAVPAKTCDTTGGTLSYGGRPVIVHMPSGATGSKPLPLVLNLHGSGSDAVQQELFTGMDAAADADGFVVAYPQGAIPLDGGFAWNVPSQPLASGAAVPKGAASDVAYLAGLVEELESRYCIDATRVYATGFSGGARMSSQVACDLSETFAAVAPVSGLRFPSPCPSKRPVPVLAFHGTADPVDPYGGHGLAYWTYSVPVAASRWATHDGCAAKPATGGLRPIGGAGGYTLTGYLKCKGGSTVELYSIAGEGHEWPGGPAMPKRIVKELGPQSQAIDANDVIWRFFAAHRL
jgi:polyhydroxybutyrate depolymerase